MKNLADINMEDNKNAEDIKIVESGVCRFCGQTVIVQVPPDALRDEIDEEASQRCTCPKARKHRAEIISRKGINAWTADEFGEGTTPALAFLHAADAVREGEIDLVSAKIGADTYSISLNKDGVLEIKKKRSDNATLKF